MKVRPEKVALLGLPDNDSWVKRAWDAAWRKPCPPPPGTESPVAFLYDEADKIE